MIKKIINVAGASLLITVAGVYIYFALKAININREIYAKAYYQEYQETKKASYLLQSAILAPDKERGAEISRALLQSRNYEVAEGFNHLYGNEDFYILAAETALFNHDYEEANRFLVRLPEGNAKKELLYYTDWATSEKPTYTNESAETENGKLMRMVGVKDFTLYQLSNFLGDSITSNNTDTPGKLENILVQAQTLAQYDLPYVSLALLEEKDYDCATDFYLVKGSIYHNNDQTEEALTTIENGLTCDPVNITLLNQALIYTTELKDTRKARYYKGRINVIHNL